MARSPYAQAFLDSLRDKINDASALGRIGAYAERNIRLRGRPFSFKGHEFQRAIVDSVHFNQATMKLSQSGLTLAKHVQVLSFLQIEQDVKVLGLLPTVQKAQKMVKSRLDPLIQGSPALADSLTVGGDSASFKQFGRNQLFMAGTFGQATISDDIDFIFVDEKDFCNQDNLATANSRLQHSRFQNPDTEERGIIHEACTPTVPGYGIDLTYSMSDQKQYLCRCPRCRKHFWPQFLRHVRIPTWDDPMEKLTYQHVLALEEGGHIAKAALHCPACGKPLSSADLGPENREWVAAYPSRRLQEGFAVTPFDLPAFHTPASILRQMVKYKSKVNHFHNFVLGLPYADASNSVVDEVVARNCVLQPVPPEVARAMGVAYTVMGLDVGLTSHLLVGVPNLVTGSLDVIWAERVQIPDADAADTLKETVLARMGQFNCRLLVCDHRPYAPTMNAIRAARPEGWVYPHNYDLSDKSPLDHDIDQKSKTLKSNRTATLNAMAAACNSGRVRFFNHAVETPILRRQLQNTKRVDAEDDDGNMSSQWVQVGDKADHYAHALAYALLAQNLLGTHVSSTISPRPSIVQAVVGSRAPFPT